MEIKLVRQTTRFVHSEGGLLSQPKSLFKDCLSDVEIVCLIYNEHTLEIIETRSLRSIDQGDKI